MKKGGDIARGILPISAACLFGVVGHLVGTAVATAFMPGFAGHLLVAFGAVTAAGWGAVLGVSLSRRLFGGSFQGTDSRKHVGAITGGFLLGFGTVAAMDIEPSTPWRFLPGPVIAVIVGLGCAGLGLVLVQVLMSRRQ